MKITLDKLQKSFFTIRGKVDVLKEVNFTIEDKEFFVLLGPSGCGKSTLLNLLAGLEKPTGGRILFDDRAVASPADRVFVTPYDRDVAFVFQSYALYPHMTIADNIAFPLTNAKKKPTKAEMDEKVGRVAKFLKIENLLDRKPSELSGGQRQRVAIGRAVVRNPQIFLMDEPLSNLDAQLRMDMRAQLKGLQENLGVTTVYVTHDQLEAMTLGTRIAVLNHGLIQQMGTPVDVYNKPANVFVARFIGAPSMNIFAGDVIHRDGNSVLKTPVSEIRLPPEAAAVLKNGGHKKAMLGVRPEHFRLVPAGAGHMDVKVDVAENIGSEHLLYSFTDAGQVVIKTTEHAETKTIGLSLQDGKYHLFDEHEKRISL